MNQVAIVLSLSAIILMVGLYTAVSSRDLIRLLISLELMFGAVFLSLIPLFSIGELVKVSFSIAVLTVFTSSAELLVLITAIIILDRQKRTIMTDAISAGGEI